MTAATSNAVNVECGRSDAVRTVSGPQDEYIRTLERRYAVTIGCGDGSFCISGGEAHDQKRAVEVLTQLVGLALRGHSIAPEEVRYAMDQVDRHGSVNLEELHDKVVCLTHRGKPIRVKTAGQKAYMRAMEKHTVVFGIGPAGTGKTYLAVCEAVRQYKAGEVQRIVLVRPAVEAGESLGYLPGDLREKVEPYLRPLYDAFFDLLSPERFNRLVDKNVIEIAPLAYMRGRTLNDSFIILDEAQNTTPEQMKMFLTRLGFGSRAVVTGDLTQVDLPNGRPSGLKIVQTILRHVEGVAFVTLNSDDVVRHEIVQRIVAAYDRHESRVPEQGGLSS